MGKEGGCTTYNISHVLKAFLAEPGERSATQPLQRTQGQNVTDTEKTGWGRGVIGAIMQWTMTCSNVVSWSAHAPSGTLENKVAVLTQQANHSNTNCRQRTHKSNNR